MSAFEDYESHPVLRSLVGVAASLVPGVAQLVPVLDAALVEQAKAARAKRLAALLDALKEGERELTPDVVRSEPFLYAFVRTAEAAVRTERREKIRYFGRLLLSGIGDKARYDLAREHEGFVKVLDDLTYRELGVLATLAEFYKVWQDRLALQPRPANLAWIWDDFVSTACERFAITEAELYWDLARLGRTGLYVPNWGGVGEENIQPSTNSRGILTEHYFRLAEAIQLITWEQAAEDVL